jgi:hypothetical protein
MVSLFVICICPFVCWILILIGIGSFFQGSVAQSIELTIAALEAASCIAVVAGCSAAFKLGIIPQDMSASSHLPLIFLLLGGFTASVVSQRL